MPTELEELVEFLHHGNTQIRQVAAEHLVGYSIAQPSIFKTGQLTPIRDLKLLVKDYPPIAKNALTMLINLSKDKEVLKELAKDDEFLESLMLRVTSNNEPNANEMAMLLANMAKSDSMSRILSLERRIPKDLSISKNAMDQLLDCFVKGAEGRYNKHADYDYLSYFFADMAKFPMAQTYLTTPQPHDANQIPLSKLQVFTSHPSQTRRLGVASALKNTAFQLPSHPSLLSLPQQSVTTDTLPYLLLPLISPSSTFAPEEEEVFLDDLQILAPDHEREQEADILKTHLETLLLLSTTREGRERLRGVGTYPIVRELHLGVEEEGVREACERLVQVLMRGEEGDGVDRGIPDEEKVREVPEEEDEDEDEQVVDVLI
ncbi:DUF383-domain-containing protein [Patellaria atrata CBS 101060]|uniref:Protein HGH1 homolog n=1 Tax=Patellaria atrata CBS 101060 TaxID=1346257 RepID=A0A9P4SJV3_9PEZI|nr:DUF383-domain-containing protein [Patellaria atrata CBS 101060]